jgi:hypothetical protein
MDLAPDWEYVADTVMGGVSAGALTHGQTAGRQAARLKGDVSLENNGGFIQMAFDLAGGAVMDASGWRGIEMEIYGNDAPYEIRLRTDALTRPWQSYRAGFVATPQWQTLRLAWGDFGRHRTDAAFDPSRLRRIGVLAIGARMQADIAVAGIGFYL